MSQNDTFTRETPLSEIRFSEVSPVPGELGWVSIDDFAARWQNSAKYWLCQNSPIHFIYWEFELSIMRELLEQGSLIDTEAMAFAAMGRCSADIAWLYLILEHPSPEWMFQALWACSIHIQRAGYLVMNEEYISEMAKRYLNMIREGAESIGEQKLYSWMASLGGPGVINI